MTNTRSQGMENGAAVTSNLTGTQQDVDLSHFLLIEKSSRHAELQCYHIGLPASTVQKCERDFPQQLKQVRDLSPQHVQDQEFLSRIEDVSPKLV
ncbi:hypothetical protein KIW84_034071 [Lathyrus oleraceus]|uniref:Uncharacterized protein n=1 Tax=Pisum sativum TaxID=3888 RepID=A0A9D5B4P2_PEA|nr:hypothetical protein KIW84_034071 [Pisum sativum]